MPCVCQDWKDNIDKLNGPIVLQTIRSGGVWQYDGKPFTHCPWCGKVLTPEEKKPSKLPIVKISESGVHSPYLFEYDE